MFEFKFPDVGEGITEGVLVRWLVKVGQSVKKESALADIETDKAVVQIPSPVDGVVTKLLYKEHDVVYVGKAMVIFDGDISQENAQVSSVEKISEKPEVKVNITKTVSFGSGNYLATPIVRDAAKKLGVDLSQVSPSGNLGNITLSDVESFARNGKPIAKSVLNSISNSSIQNQSIVTPSVLGSSVSQNPFGILATPSIRQLARDLGVDLSKVVGTGDIGKITEQDVRNALNKSSQKNNGSSQTDDSCKYKTNSTSIETGSGPVEVIKMSGIRKVISRKMTESKNTAVHFTISDEADVTQIFEMREKNKTALEAKGIKLTYLAFFTKAAVLALEKNQKINSSFNEQSEEITYKKFYNVGIAVDTEAGLMVPVIKNCESKTIVEIAVKIAELASKARERKIKIEEMTGGTFTITSVGNVSGQFFTQIINQPESAILGVGRIMDKPVVKNGQIVVRKMLTLAVTADHRIIDGADAARFLQTLINYLENPETMLLEMM